MVARRSSFTVGSPTVAGFMLDIIGKGEKEWSEFKEENPNYAEVIESNVNVGMLLAYGKGGPKVAKKITGEVVDDQIFKIESI